MAGNAALLVLLDLSVALHPINHDNWVVYKGWGLMSCFAMVLLLPKQAVPLNSEKGFLRGQAQSPPCWTTI